MNAAPTGIAEQAAKVGLLRRFAYLLRITEYSDDILRLSKHSMDLGPPRPSAGEVSGERANGHLIQSRVSGVDPAERYPPHPPAPLPRWGEGSRCALLVAA